MSLTVLVNILGSFQYSENTLLSQGRSKDDRKVYEWSHTLADSIFKSINYLLILLLNQVPFVYYNHQTLVVLLNQLKDVHILGFDTTGSIKHQDADITILDGTDRTHHRIEFQVFAYLILTTDTSCINQVKIETKLIVSGIDTITCSTSNFCHDITILTDKSIDNATLTSIRTTYYRKTRNIFFDCLLRIVLKFVQNHIKQITSTTTCSSTDTLRITQAQLVELSSLIILSTVINLVSNKDNWQFGTTQNKRHVLIPISKARVNVYQEKNQVSLFGSNKHLLADSIFKNIIRFYNPTTGINNRKFSTIPTALTILTVTSSTGSITNDSAT